MKMKIADTSEKENRDDLIRDDLIMDLLLTNGDEIGGKAAGEGSRGAGGGVPSCNYLGHSKLKSEAVQD